MDSNSGTGSNPGSPSEPATRTPERAASRMTARMSSSVSAPLTMYSRTAPGSRADFSSAMVRNVSSSSVLAEESPWANPGSLVGVASTDAISRSARPCTRACCRMSSVCSRKPNVRTLQSRGSTRRRANRAPWFCHRLSRTSNRSRLNSLAQRYPFGCKRSSCV